MLKSAEVLFKIVKQAKTIQAKSPDAMSWHTITGIPEMAEHSIETVRNGLAMYFLEKADFRRGHAERQEAWEGNKNASYADSLELLANYIRELSDDDPTLKKLASCSVLFFEDIFGVCVDEGETSETDAMAIHCGPRGEVMDPE